MALASNEVWRGGFVRNATTGALIATTSTVNATVQGGWLRDADGRLVIG